MPASKPFRIDKEGSVSVVHFAVPMLSKPGLLQELKESLLTLVKEDEFYGLLLNMDGVTFIVSACLNVLLAVDREMRTEHKPLRICCPGNSVRETFLLTH